jgi:hypothetical protein
MILLLVALFLHREGKRKSAWTVLFATWGLAAYASWLQAQQQNGKFSNPLSEKIRQMGEELQAKADAEARRRRAAQQN